MKHRAVWIEHPPSGRSRALLCVNVRRALVVRVHTAIACMGVPRRECVVRIGRAR